MAHAHQPAGPAPPRPARWPHITSPEPAQRGWPHFAWILDQTTGFLFVAVLLIAPGLLLVLTEQGKDLLRAVVQGLVDDNAVFDRTLLLLLAASMFLGLEAWFWTRWIVEFRFGPRPAWPASRYVVWTPRLLGVSPFAVLAWGFVAIRTFDVRLWTLVGLGAAFLAFVVCRAWIKEQVQGLADRLQRPKASAAVLVSFQLVHDLVFWGSVAAAAVGLVVFSRWPAQPAQFLGPAAVALIGLGLIIPIVVPAIVWGKSHAVATVPVLAAMAMLFSLWNDNHQVRLSTACPADHGACGRQGVKDAFARWQAALPADEPAVTPIIFVASQGGASRAGFWTADAMAYLEEQTHGRFSQHVFAVSSISGGTLGAAAFVAAIHDQPTLAARRRLRERVDAFVGQDYLSPAIGGLLFPDLVQRFLPRGVLPDRGTALERGWEVGWDKVCRAAADGCHRQRMSDDFLDLWKNPGVGWLPILLVGGAAQETGRPLITGSADIGPWNIGASPRDPATFVEANDFHRSVGRDVRLSTAILNGARFPYISPAGTLPGMGQHIVDGGYFDAAGVEAVRQLAGSLFAGPRPAAARSPKLKPVYLLLLNGGPPPSATEPAASSGAPKVNSFAQDLWGPVRGLFHAREAHGERLRANLDETRPASWDASASGADTTPVVIRLQVCHTLAMDWALSAAMKKTLRADLTRDQPGCPNATAIAQLQALPSPAAPAGSASPRAR